MRYAVVLLPGIRFNKTHTILAREVLEMLVLTRNTGNVSGTMGGQGSRGIGRVMNTGKALGVRFDTLLVP